MAYIVPILALNTIVNSSFSARSNPGPLSSDLARPTASAASPDRKPSGIHKYCGHVRDWAVERWRRLRPLKHQAKPLWWLRMQDNLVLSPLHQLPEETILAICRDLNGSDIYIMRQTCSLFRRILSDSEFVRPVQTLHFLRHPAPVVSLPDLQVDWEDVFERLRRRRCCSACIDARLPSQVGFGGDSAYDTVMFRMANETKYCIECRVQHPLIMFSKKQRSVETGAICIMAEGGVAICPHHTVSLKQLREWRCIRSKGGEQQTPLWSLCCDLCFQEFEEPLRSSAVQPSATCLLPEANKFPDHLKGIATQGALCVQWTMPLGVNSKTAVAAGSTTLYYKCGDRATHGAKKIEEALSRAAETGYNNLLCPHISFDDLPIFHNFMDAAYDAAHDFKEGCGWESELDPTDGFVQRPNRQPASSPRWYHGMCRVCSRLNGLRSYLDTFQRYEYLWIVGKRGLSLQRQLKMPVPDLSAPWSLIHDVWLQMLDPASYGLTADADLQHITWCPDRQCTNGRSWATHQKRLDIITEHFMVRRSEPLLSGSRIGCEPPVFHDPWKRSGLMERKHQPHTYRGLRFLPIPKPEWMRYLPDP